MTLILEIGCKGITLVAKHGSDITIWGLIIVNPAENQPKITKNKPFAPFLILFCIKYECLFKEIKYIRSRNNVDNMNAHTLIIIGISALLVALFGVGRWLYIRSMRIRNKLQMGYIFTNITHELLTPLTVVSASVDHLRNVAPEHQADYDMMQLNIERIVRLLQQILETSKSQAGELKLLVSNGDVMQYIRETARCLEPLMTKKGQQFTIRCKPESMMGWIDTDKLDKIIYNLLSNAAKYTGENGSVTLEASTNRTFDHLQIRVVDNGNGIPREKMKHLFSRFHDGEYRKSRTFGTGLGLALTRDLVYLHGGTIWCESVEGQGTAFTIDLPIGKEAFAPSQIDEQNKLSINVSTSAIRGLKLADKKALLASDGPQDEEAYKLLIVEDNEELLMLMKQLLSSKYHVMTATNGRQALDLVGSRDVDMVVSDVMMPEMDGYQLTEHLKNAPDTCHLPVILLTAKTQEEDQQQALRIGADDYIMKPFRLGDLQLRIDNILANRQRMQRDFQEHSTDETTQRLSSSVAPPEREFLQRAIDCVNQHLSDADYDRDTFAYDMGASPSTLYNKLRATTGMSVSGFIRDIRIKTACRLAREVPDIRVSDLAYSVGFKDPKYFATIFKKVTGLQPKEYIEQARHKRDTSSHA